MTSPARGERGTTTYPPRRKSRTPSWTAGAGPEGPCAQSVPRTERYRRRTLSGLPQNKRGDLPILRQAASRASGEEFPDIQGLSHALAVLDFVIDSDAVQRMKTPQRRLFPLKPELAFPGQREAPGFA